MQLFPHYDCGTCSKRAKKDRGCEKDTPYPTWTDLKGEKRSRCPRRPILENPRFFNTLVSAYNAFQNGFLPKPGGMYDQHACYSDLMSIMYETIQECDKVLKQREESRGRVNG